MKNLSAKVIAKPTGFTRSRSRTNRAASKPVIDRNKHEETQEFLKLEDIPYKLNQEDKFMEYLNDAITVSCDEIQFSKEKMKIKDFILEKETQEYITAIMKPLFWYVHLTQHVQNEEKTAEEYKKLIGRAWSLFLFNLYNECVIDKEIIIGFIDCFPYLATQILQDMFIKMSEGNPITAKKQFRMKLCSILVELFTNIDCIDAYEMDLLKLYFKNPPVANIPPELLNPKEPNKEDLSIMLPEEDLSTLTPPEKRIPQKLIHFHPTSLTPVLQSGIKRDIMPYTKKVKIDLYYPKNGVKDLEYNFPELLPDPKTEQSLTATVDTYKPMEETRSLIHRAQRRHIIDDYDKKKLKFFQKQNERAQKFQHLQDDLTIRLWQIEICKPETLTEFDNNIKKLIDEKKHEETPDFNEFDERLSNFTKERLAGTYWETHKRANNFYTNRLETANPNVFLPHYKEKDPLFHNEPVYNVKIAEPFPDIFEEASNVHFPTSKLSKQLSTSSRVSVSSEIKNSTKDQKNSIEELQREVAQWKKEIDNSILHFRIKHEDLALDLENSKQSELSKTTVQPKTETEERNQKQSNEHEKYLSNQEYDNFQEVWNELQDFNKTVIKGKNKKIIY